MGKVRHRRRRLEVSVGGEFEFVMMTKHCETLGRMLLRNLSDKSGNQYLCYTPILEPVTSTQLRGVHRTGRLAGRTRSESGGCRDRGQRSGNTMLTSMTS